MLARRDLRALDVTRVLSSARFEFSGEAAKGLGFHSGGQDDALYSSQDGRRYTESGIEPIPLFRQDVPCRKTNQPYVTVSV